MTLEDGKTYLRGDGSKETVGGTTKDHPEFVWTIQGNWYSRETGQYVSQNTQTGTWQKMPHGNWRNLTAQRPVLKFTVCIEARKRGAIGSFEAVERDTEAENPTAALFSVQAKLNEEEIETRNPIFVLDDSRKRVL